MVWTYLKNKQTFQDGPLGNSSGREKMRETEKAMVRQNQRVDSEGLYHNPGDHARSSEVETTGVAFNTAVPLPPWRVKGPESSTSKFFLGIVNVSGTLSFLIQVQPGLKKTVAYSYSQSSLPVLFKKVVSC